MKRSVKFVLAANLLALVALAIFLPQFMVSPGPLIPAHAAQTNDCFACHAPLFGVKSERCVTCHKPEDIGKLTTLGQPIVKPLTKTPFHQQLAQQNCLACHSDHAGVTRYRTAVRFDHALLQAADRAQCQSCHQPPKDALHQQSAQPGGSQCSQCHTEKKWTPANFAHERYFVLDRDHNVSCATCHPRNDYRRYTCYGCHEHSEERIWRKHIKEGIRDYQNCVECHRSADEHDIRSRGGARREQHEGKREREGHRGRKHDD